MSTQTDHWANAPGWANYFAMDADGEWYWYEKRPIITKSEDGKGVDWFSTGRVLPAGRSVAWTSTLQERIR